MLTTVTKTTVPGTTKVKLEYVREEFKRGRVTRVTYRGEGEDDDEYNYVDVFFDVELFDGGEYPRVIEAVFTSLPNEPEEDEEGSV